MTPLILAGIAAAIVIMVVFGSLSKRRELQAKLRAKQLNRLRFRARKLDSMIAGLPSKYLPKATKVLIYENIIDNLTSMNMLSRKADIGDQIQRVKQTLNQLLQMDTEAPAETQEETDHIDFKECKYLLKDLYKLIQGFHKEGKLNRKNTVIHLQIVEKVMTKIMLDTYDMAAMQALKVDNKSLAFHYFLMALGKLERESRDAEAEKSYVYFKGKVAQLRSELEEAAATGSDEATAAPESGVLAEWNALDAEDDQWKKKLY